MVTECAVWRQSPDVEHSTERGRYVAKEGIGMGDCRSIMGSGVGVVPLGAFMEVVCGCVDDRDGGVCFGVP